MPSSLKTPALSAAGLVILLIVWQIGAQLLAERMPLANMLAPICQTISKITKPAALRAGVFREDGMGVP